MGPHMLKDKADLVLGIGEDSLGGLLFSGASYPVQLAALTMAAKSGHFVMEIISDRVLSQLRSLAGEQNATFSTIKTAYIDVMDTTRPGVFAEPLPGSLIHHGLRISCRVILQE